GPTRFHIGREDCRFPQSILPASQQWFVGPRLGEEHLRCRLWFRDDVAEQAWGFLEVNALKGFDALLDDGKERLFLKRFAEREFGLFDEDLRNTVVSENIVSAPFSPH